MSGKTRREDNNLYQCAWLQAARCLLASAVVKKKNQSDLFLSYLANVGNNLFPNCDNSAWSPAVRLMTSSGFCYRWSTFSQNKIDRPFLLTSNYQSALITVNYKKLSWDLNEDAFSLLCVNKNHRDNVVRQLDEYLKIHNMKLHFAKSTKSTRSSDDKINCFWNGIYCRSET